jgi:hypothetical protein
MKKYQDALDKLYRIIGCEVGSYYYDVEFPKSIRTLQELVDKETKYQSLEEELGIDLITLFKALKDGIYFVENDFETNNKEVNFTKRPRLYYSDDFKCLCFEMLLGVWRVKLKDYGKTWALSRYELEEQKDE